MNKLFIIGSTIQPKGARLTYSETRSKFPADERFRQTIFTVNSIRAAFPDSKIIIIDSSDNYLEYAGIFNTILPELNTEFIPLKELSPDAFHTVNTHPNKSLCESLLLNTFYKKYKKRIKEYDYIIKTTGRYFYYNMNSSLFTEENKDKIFFKRPLNFEWNDAWQYHFIDRRKEQNNNRLHQYCTVLYAFGTSQLEKFIDINDAAINLLNNPRMSHYDIETLSYYLTRPFENQIIETDWKVSGWDGTSARFMYY